MDHLIQVIADYFPGGQQYSKSVRLNHIVDILTEHCKYIGLGQKSEQIYQWSSDHYEFVEIAEIGAFLQQIFTMSQWHDYKSHDAREVYNQIHQRTIVSRKNREHINNYPYILPFKGQYFNLSTGEFIAPSPDYLFLNTFSIPLGQNAECPRFRQFLDEILPDKTDQLRVLAFLCYCLTPRIDLQISQCWVGPGSNGKTELSKIYNLMMPGFVANIPFDMFMEKGNKFIGSELKNKYVNIGSEINPKSLTAGGTSCLKRWITNKTMRSEEKFGNAENIKNLTKFLFEVNELPLPTSFTDFAFFRRFQIIQFVQTIMEKQRNIMEDIFKDEGPEIARMIVSMYEMMDRYLKSNAKECERLWHLNTQSVFVYYELYCEEEGETLTEEVYDGYKQFCQLYNKNCVGDRHFGRLLRKLGVTRKFDSGFDDYGLRGHYYNISITWDFFEEAEKKKKILEKYI